jgi:ABC-2 type transport system ATP-binding protein
MTSGMLGRRDTETHAPRAGTAVSLQSLRKSWRTAGETIPAVCGIELSIAHGETVALLGPNGAGKSTTIDMILGLAQPDAGSVEVLGRKPQQAVKQGLVGAMLQNGALIRNLTVRELITMVASLYPNSMSVDDAIELAGLGDAADQRTQKLSGGQTQRARFAVAMVGDPALLILDEPTVAMDVEGRRTFWSSMHELTAAGRTVIFATHYLEEADANADRVVLMAKGQIVADGPTTELKSRIGHRQIRATLPTVTVAQLASVTGVTDVNRHGEAVTLVCSDSDTAIRELLASYPEARDIEITGRGLEDAFIELTREQA